MRPGGLKPDFTTLMAVMAHVPLGSPFGAAPVVPVLVAVNFVVQQVAARSARRGEMVFYGDVFLFPGKVGDKFGISGDLPARICPAGTAVPHVVMPSR